MTRSRTHSLLAGGATALLACGLAAASLPAQAAPAAPSAPASTAPEAVIVVLADQLTATPPDQAHFGQRAGKARAAQQAVLARLTGPKPTKVVNYGLGNAFAATVTPEQAQALAADPAVASVIPDRAVSVAPPTQSQAGSSSAGGTAAPNAQSAPGVTQPSPVTPAACSADPNHPVLEPEALQTINARSSDPNAKTAAALGIDGSGVKVAFIADGINPNNIGFRRPNGTSSIVDYKDFYGDGPNAVTGGAEAFGDASAISAQGAVFDVAQFSNPGVVSYPGTNGHCYIRIVGVAPGANVVALKAGSELLPNSAILQAIDYAVSTAHVDVLNESFGANIYPDSGARNTIQLFNDLAVRAGVTVTESTGDAGTTSTIGSDATDPNVISAGATTDSRIYEQTGYALATAFGNGRWQDDNVSSLSSAGITENGRTIDVSAPGEADWALCDASGRFTDCVNWNGQLSPIQSFGGTSQAAPLTAGVSALVIQAYRKTHGGSSPTPAVVKQIITSTAHDLGFAGDVQGTGRIDARAAVEEALSWTGGSGAPSTLPSNLALSTDQLTVAGTPGTRQTGTVTVTNVGSQPLTVLPSSRRYTSLGVATKTVAIGPSGPTIAYPTSGAPWAYRKVSFDVPAGTDVLDSTIRWQSGATPGQSGPAVRLSLFAPDGTYAANTRPQGGPYPANYGDVLVRQPAAGTWTAVIYTAVTGGFTGNVVLRTNPQRAIPDGTVSPSPFTLQPGASRAVTIGETVPAVGGDAVYTVALAASNGRQVAVPVIARAVVPTSPQGVGTFAGTINGGNARAGAPAQTFSYEFDVPAGQRDLDVSVTLANGPGDVVQGVLVDPNGETPSIASNVTPAGQGRSMANTVADPIAGRWHYVVVVANPVTGAAFANDFTGQVAFNRIGVTASVGSDRSFWAGTTRTFTVTVTNPGPAPLAVQADPRTTDTRQLQLAPQGGSSTISLPLSVDNIAGVPTFLIPPDTTRASLSAASTVPAQVEFSSPGQGIDVFGDLNQARQGNTISTATVSEQTGFVGQGNWLTYVQEIGPFGNGGAPAGTSTLVGHAMTQGFDRTVTTSVGDPYLASVDPTAPAGKPIIIAPGKSATITVHITPAAGAKGTVRGVLNLVTPPSLVPYGPNVTGDVIAAIPYSYYAG